MNLEKSGRKLVVVAAVAMLAMVVQGCGGDDGVSQGRFDDEVAKAAAAEAARTKAEAEKTAADAAKTKARAEAAEAEAARKKAAAEAAEAEAARTKAQTDKAAADKARMEAEQARKAAETAATEAAAAAKKLQDAEDERQAEIMHNEAEADFGTLGTTRRRKDTTQVHATSIDITNNIKLTSSTLRAEYKDYTQAEAAPLAMPVTGWPGARLVRGKNNIVVYSDLGDNKKLFRDVYTRTIVPNKADTYAITQNGTGNTLKRTDVKGDPGEQVKRTGGTTNTGTSTLKVKALGTIPGTLTCTETPTNCATSTTGTGAAAVVSPTNDNWKFIPDNANAVTYNAYFLLGWWNSPTIIDLFYDYREVGRIHRDGSSSPRVQGDEITGAATYTGVAAGRYAMRKPAGQQGTQTGTFTASARLAMDFDADKYESSGAADDIKGILVTGTIDNFRGEHADIGIDKWKVSLYTDGANAAGVQAVERIETVSGVVNYARWSLDKGKTYASATETLTVSGQDDQTVPAGRFSVSPFNGADSEAPAVVVGEFRTHIANFAELLGAFVTEKNP